LKFSRRVQAGIDIPTASLPDIVFLLLIFFLVTTTFKEFKGIPVHLPSGNNVEKLPGKRNVVYIFIDEKNRIMIDDRFVEKEAVADFLTARRINPTQPLKIVSLQIDKKAKMSIVNYIHNELRAAKALTVNYSVRITD
jgi:biopolymer transport protein ExbD